MRYDAVLIDADDTLFDFQVAEKAAIAEVVARLSIQDMEAPQVYHRLNRACWQAFEKGQITQAQLQVKRFRDFLAHYSLSECPEEVGALFEEALSRQSMLIDGALEAVRKIAASLPIAIVTNGIARVQHGRMEGSSIREYIKALVISGEEGFQKPDPRMILRALERLGGVKPAKALMVGDSLTSDILAANRAGADACWYNPEGKPVPEEFEVQYILDDIRCLPEIVLAQV